MAPIFIISLPRSGSTLLQKILTVHKSINSVSEPWILLPLAGMVKRDLVTAEYGQLTCSMALEDLINTMPRGRDDFNALIADYVRSIYMTVSDMNGTKYFLDKTPSVGVIEVRVVGQGGVAGAVEDRLKGRDRHFLPRG